MKNEVFIVGGGSSLKGIDFSLLMDKETIAVNMSALHVPNPTFSITADSSILKRIQKGEFKHVKTSWVLVTNPNHCTMQMNPAKQFVNIKTGFVYNLFCMDMVIKNKDVDGIGYSFNDFRTGYNSGFCAYQLAVLLGYKKIYLMGIDLTCENKCHFHDYYNGRIIPKTDFEKYELNFRKAIKKVKEEKGIETISLSKISTLNNIIEYKNLSEVLNG